MLQIIYEDNHLIAANKPNGMLVQKDTTGDESLEDLVRAYIKVKYQKPGEVYCHATHRIDRPVSGVVLFAKTSKSLARINEYFKQKTIQKSYLALVHGTLDLQNHRMVNWLMKDAAKNKTRVYDTEKNNSQIASMVVSSINTIAGFTKVKINLETGRHHQIRAQLAHLGHTIVGDSKYGSQVSCGPAIYLHSAQLMFEHPVTKSNIEIIAPCPDLKFWNQFA